MFRVAAARIAVNMGMLVGLGSVRHVVIGPENRNASAGKILKMKELARRGMRDGAFGISTGLFYIPGAYTPTGEIIALAKVVAE